MERVSTKKIGVFTGVCLVLGINESSGPCLFAQIDGYPQSSPSYPQISPEVCVRQTFTFSFRELFPVWP